MIAVNAGPGRESELVEITLEADSMTLLRAFQTVGRGTWREMIERNRDKALRELVDHLIRAINKAGWRVFAPKREPGCDARHLCKSPDKPPDPR